MSLDPLYSTMLVSYSSRHIKAFHMAYVKEDGTGSAMAADEGSHEPIMQRSSAAGDDAEQTLGEQPAHMINDAQQHHAALRITFLYKLQQGAVDQSFGLNVAQVGINNCAAHVCFYTQQR
jgi:hypothetical protein